MSVSLAWQTTDWLRLLRAPAHSASTNTPAMLAAPALERLEPLFGPSSVASDAAPPATNLRLSLHGSFVHADPQRSSAIIQREGSKPQRYAVGAELNKGVRLHAVYRDRVELERNGRLESLPFPTRKSSANSVSDIESAPAEDPTNQLSTLQEDNAAQLRERMDALRQQMDAAGTLPAIEPNSTEQPTESD
ncbi:general secretion pathway protein GspN [Pseudomonas cavernicola]|uniref:General secretion pathway protein GspN n=1 Tax=Pseudomonas cavernicola TaxID=2320866 RepID=A0A418XPJ3_9PSED|nr:type II secretion system protein N [Pseudomonas cavernicola]RJG14399.1 general secretion pathway protein GspN [Pseudomonas cavernicola]